MNISILFIVGAMILVAFYGGKASKLVKLPSIIGYMIVGVLIGPSLFNVLNTPTQEKLSFLTDVALGFVALSIGLELNFKSLKRLGKGIITVIFSESLMAFILVTLGTYFLTKNLPLALILGAIAPASAPAGTVAVIQEYKAKGPLTEALYAVVGFDDGLGIIIFGFASAIAQSMLKTDGPSSIGALLLEPLKEIILAIIIGLLAGFLFILLAKTLKNKTEKLIFIFGLTLAVSGLCNMLKLSLILTNMVYGILIVNTQTSKMVNDIKSQLENIMPLIFVIFFTLAGANLHISAIPSLGIIGGVYILCRTIGLISGASFGATISKMDTNIKKYLGLGIISQAGVAIGLALNVKNSFSTLGENGLYIGMTVITMVTATSIFFEFVGPPLTKIGLSKAGEIQIHKN